MNTIYIKNMVCGRCITAVERILRSLNLPYSSVILGEVQLDAPLDGDAKAALAGVLKEEGFELIDDKKSRLVSQIKGCILEYVKSLNGQGKKVNISKFLTENLHLDYPYLSTLFSSIEGQTIENYLIAQKIERAKELLVYDELSLSEIAFLLGYSSTAHLSGQFKKVTGLTPSHFKLVGAQKRLPLDKV